MVSEGRGAGVAEDRARDPLLDALGEAVIATDLDGRVVHWNRAAERMFGWTREEALGRSVLELTPAVESRDSAHEIMDHLVRGESWQGEFILRRRDGTSFPALVTDAPIHDGAGALVGVVGISRDISDLKRVEAQREAEGSRLARVFTRAPALIAVMRGPDHVIEMANPRYLESIGRDVVGRPARETLAELQEQDLVDLLDEVLRSGTPCEGLERRMVLPPLDGGEPRERFCNVVCEPLRAGDGSITGIFFHGVDVTDLVQARNGAEAASRAKSDVMAVMSHELRTPLNAILGYASLLEAGIPEPLAPGPRERVGRLVLSARHLRRLIDDILSLMGVEGGGDRARREEVDVAEILREVRTIAEPLAAERGLALAVHAGGVGRLVTDASKLRQILLNLVGNAVKFTAHGGVTVRAVEADGSIRFAVEDTGPGIDPADVERLFEPFWRSDLTTTRASGGTGLGLAISRRLARLLGGDVEVESEKGAGSVFTLRLPLTPPDGESAA